MSVSVKGGIKLSIETHNLAELPFEHYGLAVVNLLH